MNKLKYFLLLVLCAGLIGSAPSVSAQSGKVLVSAGGKQLRQSDVDKMIQFYEWAFETEFSADQRARFTENTVEEFRANPAESRATTDSLLESIARIFASSEAAQQKTRESFLANFIAAARKSSEANGRLLVEIYDAAQGASNENVATNGSNDAADSNDSNAGNISALAGKWVWGRSGSSTYTTGGAYMGSNGSRHTYQFNANGTVEYTGIMNIMTGGCTMQVFKSAKGRANLNGNTLTINWAPAAFSRADSCSPSKDYKKTLPAETETFQVQFKSDYGQRQLCLTSKEETCFSPEK
jgi:hypothetical protein